MSSEKNDLYGVFSVLGTLAVMALIGFKAGVFGLVLKEVWLLVTGNVGGIVSLAPPFLLMFPIIMATVVLELPCSVLAAIFQGIILGNHSGDHSVSEMFRDLREGKLFRFFFLFVLAEELFARGLFLGLLTKLPLFSGVAGFYFLFLLGNGIWSLIHLGNFKNEGDRHVLRVLPQFVAGIFFTYVYVKYGLLASVLTHFVSNAVLFASHRLQNIDHKDALITGYSALTAVASYSLMEKSLTDTVSWFKDEPTFALPGWSTTDYLLVAVFVTSTLMAVTSILLYDRGDAGKKESGPMVYMLAVPIMILVVYFLFTVLGLFIVSVPYRILAIAILVAFAQEGASGSAMARTFWTVLLDVYVAVCIIKALDPLSCVALLVVGTIIQAPRIYLTRYDD